MGLFVRIGGFALVRNKATSSHEIRVKENRMAEGICVSEAWQSAIIDVIRRLGTGEDSVELDLLPKGSRLGKEKRVVKD